MHTTGNIPVDAQASRLIQLIGELRRIWGKDFKRGQAIADLSETQFQVLRLLERLHTETGTDACGHCPCPISTLAARLNLNPATVVRAVDSLERKQFVRRRRCEADHRQIHIEITARGAAVRAEMLARFHAHLVQLLQHMEPDTINSLIVGLEGLVCAARELHAIPKGRKGN